MLSLGCSACRATNATEAVSENRKLAHPIAVSNAASSVEAMSPVASNSDAVLVEVIEKR
jgi:hypothetical protein